MKILESVRQPAVAGQFYPAQSARLRQAISDCYGHALGPGETPKVVPRPVEGVVGFVAPHAGYVYSGPVAAHVYHRLAALGRPSVVVVLGPNHHGAGGALALSAWESWDTPLGSLPVDTDLGERLAVLVAGLKPDADAHRSEHSLEVQLPFLAHLYGSDVPILPIAMADQSLATAVRLGRGIAEALAGRGAAVLASTDLSHYLPDREARREDSHVIQAITSLAPERLDELVRHRGINMCGPGPVMAMLACVKELGGRGARLLAYATSANTHGGPERVVGYAAAAVEVEDNRRGRRSPTRLPVPNSHQSGGRVLD